MATKWTGWTNYETGPTMAYNLGYDFKFDGSKIHYKLGFGARVNDNSGWYNNRLAVEFLINGQSVGYNITVKPKTEGDIGKDDYYASTKTSGSSSYSTSAQLPVTGSIDSTTGSVTLKIRYRDTGFGYGESGTYSWGTPNKRIWDTNTGNSLKDFSSIVNDNMVTAPTFTSVTATPSRTGVSIAITGTAGDNGGSVTYSTVVGSLAAVTGTNPQWSNLTPNTTYNYTVTATNGESLTTKYTGSFTTTGNAPSISSASVSGVGRTGATITPSVTYDTNASLKTTTIKYGTSTSYGSTSTSNALTGLTPNTTYYYSVTVTDNFGRTSTAYTGSFKTDCNAPTIADGALKFSTNDPSSITVTFVATGDTNAAVTNYIVYYKKTDATSYSNSGNLGTATSYKITGLSADTNYNIYFTATNVKGTTTSKGSIYSTDLNAVSLSLATPTIAEDTANDGKFKATLKPSASVSPSRTITYTYSCSLSGVSAVTTTSATHTFTNLPEETAITFTVKAVADAVGNNAKDKQAQVSKSITTDSAQARVRMKINGAWVQGKLFIKKDGTWVKAKKVYIKKSGAWVQGKNQ